VLYGPFSAAYGGNSVGAVVDYVTRMPAASRRTRSSRSHQPFELYGTDDSYQGRQGSFSLGNRQGGWSWYLDLSRTGSDGQPLTFPTRLPGAGAGIGRHARDRRRRRPGPHQRDWLILGAATQYHTVQDQLKAKLAYDFSPTLRATWVFGLWDNDSEGRPPATCATPPASRSTAAP
jgi:iron complex outermembrane receptor protein